MNENTKTEGINSNRAQALLDEIYESGSAVIGRNDHAAAGELVSAGYGIYFVPPSQTMVRDMDSLREKGFDEIALRGSRWARPAWQRIDVRVVAS
jgi:hypothetical protein